MSQFGVSTNTFDPCGIVEPVPEFDAGPVHNQWFGFSTEPEGYVGIVKKEYTAGRMPAMHILSAIGNWLRANDAEFTHELERDVLSTAANHLANYVQVEKQNETRTKENRLKPEFSANQLYRMYYLVLRWIKGSENPANAAWAGNLLREISLLTNLPFAELECPDWVDGYTGEIIDEQQELLDECGGDEELLETVNLMAEADKGPKGELALTLERLRTDLGYGDKEIAQFLAAQEGFDGVSDDIPVFEDIRDDVPEPVWMEMQHDMAPTPAIHELRKAFKPLRDDALDYSSSRRDFWNAELPNKKGHWSDVMMHVRQDFASSQQATAILDHLRDLIANGEKPTDIATLWLSVQNGMLFLEGDAHLIKLGLSYDLFEWLEENGDELMENLNDASPRWEEVSPEMLEQFDQETMALIAASCKTEVKHGTDVFQHPSFVTAYIDAVKNLKPNDGPKAAIAAGWEGYRQFRSPEGNKLYHEAKKAKKTDKEAMSIFWSQTRKEEAKERNRKRIVGIDAQGHGLTLEGGRKIDWHIAILKLQNDELRLSQEDKARLKNLLVEKGWGAEFCKEL